MNASKISGDKSYQRQLFFRRYGIVFCHDWHDPSADSSDEELFMAVLRLVCVSLLRQAVST